MVDIIIRNAEDVPERAHLSVRVGDVRRLMQYKAGSRFKFDDLTTPRSFMLDVFQKVGSAQVCLDDLPLVDHAGLSTRCREGVVEVLLTSGAFMKVDVQVAPLAPVHPRHPADEVLKGGKVESMDQHYLAAAKYARVETADVKKAHHQIAALKAKGYLDGHAVQKVLQAMIHDLLEVQPEDPLGFMVGYLQDAQARTKAAMLARQQADALATVDDEPPGFPADGSKPLPDLSAHHNLMAKLLRQDTALYERMSKLRTPLGVTFAKCIKSGVDNPGVEPSCELGVFAGDAACYNVFSPAFEPVVSAWHGGYAKAATHPTDLDVAKIPISTMDAISCGRVLSVRISAVRNLQGVRFPGACSFEERRVIEGIVTRAFTSLEGSLRGRYLPLRGSLTFAERLGGMNDKEEALLRDAGWLIDLPASAAPVCGGLARHWPHARGVFHSHAGDFAVTVNEADHLRIISQRFDGDLKKAFDLFVNVEKALGGYFGQEGYSYSRTPHLGFLSTCPSRLGTGMSVSVLLRLPRLTKPKLQEACEGLGVMAQWQLQQGSGTTTECWEVTCLGRLGISEVDQVNKLAQAAVALLGLEAGAEEESDDEEETPDGLGDIEYPGFPADVCPEEMPDLSKHHNMMAQVLRKNPAIYHNLRSKSTSMGVPFAKCIKAGFDNPGHPFLRTVFMVAGDPDSYEVFRELFDPVISMRHEPVDATRVWHTTDMDPRKVNSTKIDPSGNHVMSVRMRVSRNFTGLRMTPACSRQERCESERIAVHSLLCLAGDLQGDYYPLRGSQSYIPRPGGMSGEEEVRLRQGGWLFEEPDSDVLLSSGFGRHWPEGRGVFVSRSQSLVATVNEEDHLRVELMENGQDVKRAFRRLCEVHVALEKEVQGTGYNFASSSRLGFLGVCPCTLGTCLTINVKMRLPKLAKTEEFPTLVERLGVQARMHWGPPLRRTSRDGVFDISNSDRLGSTEVDQVNLTIEACRILVDIEERLMRGDHVDLEAEPAVSLSMQKMRTSSPLARNSAGNLAVKPIATDKGPSLVTPSSLSYSAIADLGPTDYPGFPTEACPADMPNLANHHSLMAAVLRADPSIYEALRCSTTTSGVSFARCVKTGFDNCGHPMIKTIGLVAGDAESYTKFSAIFDPIIKAAHGKLPEAPHSPYVDGSKLALQEAPLDPTGKYVVSVHLRVQRNLAALRFPPAIAADERAESERVLVRALEALAGEFRGNYYALAGSHTHAAMPNGMDEAEQAKVAGAGLLFEAPDAAMMLSSGSGRDWPHARGVFVSDAGTLAAWVNDADHLRLMSMQSDADIATAFCRLVAAESALRGALERDGHSFAWDSRLGYLTSCPSNLGTGMRITVILKLPKLSVQQAFRQLCRELKLQARACGGNDPELREVSNFERVGPSALDILTCTISGVRRLLDLECRLARGEKVDLSTAALVLPCRSHTRLADHAKAES